MSETTSQFRAISQRRQTISGEIEVLKEKIAELQTEFNELEIAARVLSRLGLVAEQKVAELPVRHADAATQKLTVPDMIRIVVKEYHDLGIGAPDNTKILQELSSRWGVNDPNAVRPTLWRMVKDSRLEKNGQGYSIPNASPFGGVRPS